MQQLYRIFRPANPAIKIPFYFIESTAPNNVDDDWKKAELALPGFTEVDLPEQEKELDVIAARLLPEDDPSPESDSNLVVMVHGFNTPRNDARETFIHAAEAVLQDKEGICSQTKLVCIGYRWPSESIGSPIYGSIRALPLFALILFLMSLLVLTILLEGDALREAFKKAVLDEPLGIIEGLLKWMSVSAIVVTLVGIILRAAVYFRDIYRATNFGVPDLVEVIRNIDRAAWKRTQNMQTMDGRRRRIALSFIGHSMGGLVVTNVIRILSDVFDPQSQTMNLAGQRLNDEGEVISGEEPEGKTPSRIEPVPAQIGNVFELMRFVLVSPDIPAEALLGNRANFLKSSLCRFKEAYLFSSEGDEVLRQISTIANYFSFPTSSNRFGYRLGNVEILSTGEGVIDTISTKLLPDSLRVGVNTIGQLNGQLRQSLSSLPSDPEGGVPADAFSYFDCTDCVDMIADAKEPQPILTFAHRYKATDPKGKIPPLEHFHLLLVYVFGHLLEAIFLHTKRFYINVHGGYFDGRSVRLLIYRLACLGYHGTLAAYGRADKTSPNGREALSRACRSTHMKVRLSDRLEDRPPRPSLLQMNGHSRAK